MKTLAPNVASARWPIRGYLHILAIDTICDPQNRILHALIGSLFIKLYVCTDRTQAAAPRQIEPSDQVSSIAIVRNSKIFDSLVKFPISSHRRTVAAQPTQPQRKFDGGVQSEALDNTAMRPDLWGRDRVRWPAHNVELGSNAA